jgi:long-chain acyl-CoA synthetase
MSDGQQENAALTTMPREGGETESASPGARTYASNPEELPEGTLIELFFRAIDEIDKADAQLRETPEGWKPISHRRILEEVHTLSDALVELGIRRGDRVAILSENRPEWPLADYALLCTGALTVPVYPTLPANQVAHIIDHSGARLVFVSTAEQLEKLLEVRAELSKLETIVSFEKTEGFDVMSLDGLMARGREAGGSENAFRLRALGAMPGDVATVIYTSGTTGVPKGVMLTHSNLHSNVLAAVGAIAISPADVSLSFLPLSHVFQRTVDFGLFTYGCTIAYVGAFDEVAKALPQVQPTVVVAVPRVYEKIYAGVLAGGGVRRRLVSWARGVALEWARAKLDGRSARGWLKLQYVLADRLVYRKLRARLGGRLRFGISGGAPLSSDIALFFYGAGVLILEGYGLTETSPVTNVNTPSAMRFGTVGKPVASTEIRIAEDGEVLARGPQVMKGYLNNAEATRNAIDAEGWFHTGDIGALDADGYLRITDRKKDLLKTAGGKFVAPQPIQDAVKRSRFVAEAVLIGDRRPYPILIVVPNFETAAAWARANNVRAADHAALVADPAFRAKVEEEVETRLEGFARYELPKKVLLLDRELSVERGEITPTLKVKRKVVEEQFAERIEALYAETSEDGESR